MALFPYHFYLIFLIIFLDYASGVSSTTSSTVSSTISSIAGTSTYAPSATFSIPPFPSIAAFAITCANNFTDLIASSFAGIL